MYNDKVIEMVKDIVEFCIAMADSKVTKVLGVVAITLMSISFLGR